MQPMTDAMQLFRHQRAVGSTTLSGYVDTSLVWRPQSQNPHGVRAWLRTFFLWFRFHALS